MWSGSVSDIQKQYEDGLPGYIEDVRAKIEFLESQQYQAFSEPNLKGSGRGKRALLWAYVRKLDPTAFTEVQTTGDCVAHGSRNAREGSRAVEILVNKEPEDWFKRGATEPTYGARGHSGQGMAPARASRFERDVGFLARHKYPMVDLSKYDSSIGSRWGSSGVPEDVKALCRQNKVGVISNVVSQEDLMDALFNGYAAHSGQSAAWSATPNSKNIHPRAAVPWAHDLAILGYDDTQEFWPFRVWFLPNSWGRWNQPVKDWPKSYPEQIPGMIVTSAEDFNVCVASGDCWTYGKIGGYPPQKLPDFGTIGLLQNDE